MAKYRMVRTEFWENPVVEEMTPEEKYFYLYLLTNSKTIKSAKHHPIFWMVPGTFYCS